MSDNKIISIGEVLIDWTCLNRTLDLNKANEFIKLPGGAPANVAVALAKLNYPIQFVGGFSHDMFGDWLKEYLVSFGVDVSKSQTVLNSSTRCAYVLTDENGSRVFKGFSKNSCADSLLNFETLDMNSIKNATIVYFGSLLQACNDSRKTIQQIIDTVKTENALLVYDPNLRLFLWPSLEEAIEVIKSTIKSVDVLKLSDDEINLVSGIENNIEEAAQKVFDEYKNLKLLVVTVGPEGSFFINKNGKGHVKPFKVSSVEMTGAGDGFVSGLLGGLYDYIQEHGVKIEDMATEKIKKILIKANAIGALATTKPGAMSALPTEKELNEFLSIHL